jgi:adenylate cyclase
MQGTQEVSVCFADAVGFTSLGEILDAEGLGAVTGRLAEMASEVAGSRVRLVKMIGDAAMLVSPDGDALLDAALSLVEAAEAEGGDFPVLRAGVARGDALPRGGDWYGRPVNLASRITNVAYPGSVLAAGEAHDAAANGYRWSFAGARRLKGIDGEVKLFRCRRDETPEDD